MSEIEEIGIASLVNLMAGVGFLAGFVFAILVIIVISLYRDSRSARKNFLRWKRRADAADRAAMFTVVR